jgi:hypothetical protein
MYSLILLVILHIVPLSVSRRQDIVSCRSDCQMARMCRPRRLNDRHQNTRQQNQPNRHVLCEVQLLVRYRALLCRATTPPGEAEFKPRDPWRRDRPRAKMIPRGELFFLPFSPSQSCIFHRNYSPHSRILRKTLPLRISTQLNHELN